MANQEGLRVYALYRGEERVSLWGTQEDVDDGTLTTPGCYLLPQYCDDCEVREKWLHLDADEEDYGIDRSMLTDDVIAAANLVTGGSA